MRYLSVCSGIEAASVAWGPLGWDAVAFSEIDPTPSAVLAYHYPEVPNLGDFTKIERLDAIDLLVGGTPCQSFSVAGLRGGMDDERGGLALEYLRLADRLRPRWVVWENVPGVLSSNGGRDFGSFLGGLVELGYGFAYRVLDAQHFGVPQRRRRVFVVGCLGDWRRAASVLFERQSLRRNPSPSREAGSRVARTIAGGAHPGGFNGRDIECGNFVEPLDYSRITGTYQNTGHGWWNASDVAATVRTPDGGGSMEANVAVTAFQDSGSSTWRAGLGPMSRSDDNGTNHVAVVTPVTPIPFDTTQITSRLNRNNPKFGDLCHPVTAAGDAPAIAFQERGREGGRSLEWQEDQSYALRAIDGGGCGDWFRVSTPQMSVRRLTPRECERLQGFPDDYTLIPYRGKMMADGPRYKMIGNSMAVPVMRWIGERIQLVENLTRPQ